MVDKALPEQDPQALSRFIERSAAYLEQLGVPRMAARIFMALTAADPAGLTAAQLAEQLKVSPAAISGAVRFLGQVGMVVRTRDPGSRRDRFYLHDDMWVQLVTRKDRLTRQWQANLSDAIEIVGADTPAGKRLADTVAFMQFLTEEMAAALEKWRGLQHGIQ